MHFKAVFLSLSLLSIYGCGPSEEEKTEVSYDAGYSDGYREGAAKALECVNREGGGAEDAADSCEGRL